MLFQFFTSVRFHCRKYTNPHLRGRGATATNSQNYSESNPKNRWVVKTDNTDLCKLLKNNDGLWGPTLLCVACKLSQGNSKFKYCKKCYSNGGISEVLTELLLIHTHKLWLILTAILHIPHAKNCKIVTQSYPSTNKHLLSKLNITPTI